MMRVARPASAGPPSNASLQPGGRINGSYQPSAATVANPSTAASLALFNKSGKAKNKAAAKGKLDKSKIGAPSNFVHVSHLGFDAKEGKFDQRNIPEEWNQIFKAAGVTSVPFPFVASRDVC